MQGCGITDNADGTHDIAPGLVALTGTDPEGVQRVMVMPFAGASGVALPLYLTAQAQVVERVYGDGKVKPVAHAYTAQAAGVLLNDADGEPLPHLTLTAEGGNRFVDAVQDTAHRFISDAERSKWNRILEQAKAYADSVATTGSAAALRSAKEYTDTRETAILAQADTKDAAALRSAKEYADQVVAALVDGSPEALNTLQELAAALGGDPNFATTVMQLIGERATMAQVNAALEGKADVAGSLSNMFKALYFEDNQGRYNIPITGVGYTSDVERTNTHRFCTIDYFKTQLGLWHSGNFDPAGLQKTTIRLADDFDLNSLHTTGTYDTASGVNSPVPGFIYIDVIKHTGTGNWVSQTVYTLGGGNAPNRIFHRNGMNSSGWTGWVELLHSGNFDPAGCLRQLGRFEPGGSIDNTGIGCGFNYANSGSGVNGSFLTFGHPGYEVELVTGYSSWQNGDGIMQFRTKNGDNGTWNPWRTIYNSGNLGLATAAANGLMAAADKAKLDSSMKILAAGVVGEEGNIIKQRGFFHTAIRQSVGYYRIFHGIGHVNYEVQITCLKSSKINGGHASVLSKTTNYFDMWTADDESANDLSFFFQIYEF